MSNRRRGFSTLGTVVGQTPRTRYDQKSDALRGNKVTMGNGVPRQSEGAVGDITVRKIPIVGLRAYIKTDSGWFDINTMVTQQVVEWIPMVLSGTFAAFADFGEPGYIKDVNGFVHLRGGVDSGGVTSSITTLPPGFRPIKEQRRLVTRTLNASAHIQQIRIQTSGEINRPYGSIINLDDSVDADTVAEICFDGISFFAGQSIVGAGGGSGTGGAFGGGAD